VTLRARNVTLDCGDTLAVARFWSVALGAQCVGAVDDAVGRRRQRVLHI